MELNIVHDEDDLRFYTTLGEEDAELTYTYPEEGVMDFDHTFVPKEHRNKGMADQLVKAGLEYVKEKKYKFIPSCPAVEAYVKRHPQYNSMMG